MSLRDAPPRLHGRRATIADVARHAGVAKSTVSNYLNRSVRVSADVSARVAKAIDALEYKPSQIARSFTSRRHWNRSTQTFGAGPPCLVTVGHVSVDYIAAIEVMPVHGDRTMAREIFKALGGPAANVAVIAAGLGKPWEMVSSLITLIGEDQDSDWAVAELGARQVEIVAPTERRDGRLARALILVEPSAKRTIIAEPVRVGEVDVARFIAETDTSNRRWCLHFEGFQVPQQMAYAADARRAGFRVTMQSTGLTSDWFARHASDVFRTHDIAILHHRILDRLVDTASRDPQALAAWIAEQARTAPEGDWPVAVLLFLDHATAAMILRDGSVLWQTVPPVKAVDETGAIDAFAGTFLALWLHDAPPDQALRIAVAAASLAVTRFGAQEVRPTTAELLSLLGMTTAPHPVSETI